MEALNTAARRGARIASVCIGAFALAAAGLLDGREATTHWQHADDFAARFPAVRLRAEVLYVDEGDILTSGGIAPASTCACTCSDATTVRRPPPTSRGAW